MFELSPAALQWLGVDALVAVADTPSYLPLVFEVAIVLAVVRLLYRLHTYTPTNTA